MLPVELPPLRERPEDIPPLVEHCIQSLNQQLGREVVGLTPEAEAGLATYHWPGNVRELRNAVERAMLLTDATRLDVPDFPVLACKALPAQPRSFDLPPDGVVLEEVERDLLLQALQRTGWNRTRAAKLLGLNRDQIRYRITKFSLDRDVNAAGSSG